MRVGSDKLKSFAFKQPSMLTEEAIQDAVRRVVAAAHSPVKVIVFGSYARGDATDASDLDLMVIERDVRDAGEEMIRLNDAVAGLDLGVDILVYSEEEFEKRRGWRSTPVYWAAREGKVLYERRG